MSLEDYKKLERLRIRNYITIIKMLFKIYAGRENYKEMYLKLQEKLI
jgi:hypothetical protein